MSNTVAETTQPEVTLSKAFSEWVKKHPFIFKAAPKNLVCWTGDLGQTDPELLGDYALVAGKELMRNAKQHSIKTLPELLALPYTDMKQQFHSQEYDWSRDHYSQSLERQNWERFEKTLTFLKENKLVEFYELTIQFSQDWAIVKQMFKMFQKNISLHFANSL